MLRFSGALERHPGQPALDATNHACHLLNRCVIGTQTVATKPWNFLAGK
jgi:hypothetical protein